MKFCKIAISMLLIINQNNCMSANQGDIHEKDININLNISNISCNTAIQDQIQYLQNQIDLLRNSFYRNKRQCICEHELCKNARRMISARLSNRCRNELMFEEKLDNLNKKIDSIFEILSKRINKLNHNKKKSENSAFINKKRKLEQK